MSVIARVFEEAGLPTVVIALIKEHAEKVKPSRALFVPFPYGYPMGKPNDADFQHRVIGAALNLLRRSQGPVLEDFPDEAGPTEFYQASAVTSTEDAIKKDAANEVTALRAFYERWIEDGNGRTAVGLSGIPQRRFRGMVRFLQDFSMGEETDMKERPQDMPLPQYVRYCVDDLKAFFFESRMAQRPQDSEPELQTWFWGDTAAGQLVAAIAKHMVDTGDEAMARVANGIAR